jgi:small subunit ribosomal protein S15
MTEHLKVHKKDRHSRRGMMAMINKRRSMLRYLRRSNFERYKWTIGELGLKDVIRHTSGAHPATS